MLNNLKRCLAAVGVGVCLLFPYLAVLLLIFRGAGLFWFLCTWMFVAFFGFVIGLIVLPNANPVS